MAINFTKESQESAFTPARTVTFRPTRPLAPIVTGVDISNQVKSLQAKVPALLNAASILPTGTPLPVSFVTATQQPFKTQGRTVSLVSVSFVRNPADPNYDHVNIWFKGYEGTVNLQEVAQGTLSPISFLVESTGETVTVLAQAASSNTVYPIVHCPTTTVTLNGVVGAPPAPTIQQVTTPIVGGYQFIFFQEGGLLADVISGYNVYRNTLNTTSGAAIIQHLKQNPSNNGTVVVQDLCGGDKTFFYWVSSINTTGLESALTPANSTQVLSITTTTPFGANWVPNPSFEFNTVGVPYNNSAVITALTPTVADGWYLNQTDTHGYWTPMLEQGVAPYTGNNNLLIRLAQGGSIPSDNVFYPCRVYSTSNIPVVIGQYIRVSAYMRWDYSNATIPAGVTIQQRVGVYIYAQNGSTLGELVSDISNHSVGAEIGSWYKNNVTFQVPATLGGGSPSNIVIELCGFVKNNSGSTWNIGANNFADLRFDAGSIIAQSTAFDATPLNTAYSDTSTTAILSQSGTSTTINVAAFNIQYGDGLVAYNSGSVNPGSLGTWYVYCIDATYSGGAVTYLASANNSTLTATNGNIMIGKITTVGGGGGTGGGFCGGGTVGGGRTGGCFTPNTLVKTPNGARPISHIKPEEWVLTNRGYRQVAKVFVHDHNGTLLDMGHEEGVTHAHHLQFGPHDWRPASQRYKKEFQYTGRVHNLEIRTQDDDERNYVLENAEVAHNFMKT